MRTGNTAHTNATFGEGTAPILLDNVECNGFETSLLKCDHNVIGFHDCTHQQDAGVVCITSK